MRFKPFVSLLVIAILLLSIFSPIVEASVVYGPSQFRGDWYSGAVSDKTGNAISSGGSVIVNGSGSIVNGSKVANGSPAVSALPSVSSNNVNPSVVYSAQYSYAGSNAGALGDYQRVMGQYCPEVQLDGTGGVKVNSANNRNVQKDGQAGSDIVFKYLDKYVETSNFSIVSPHGNYTLYLRNGDSSGKFVRNGTIFYVRLNGKDIFTPLDYSLTNQVLKKKVTVSQNDTLQVFAVGLPGSYLTLWLEDESPDIVITSPMDDTVSNGTITLAGYTTDHAVKTVTVKQSNNSTITSIPVSNGNFSTSLYIRAPVKLTLSITDGTGMTRTTSLSLDGDYLPTQAELQYGFDPLKPDSDSKLTMANEANNGVIDGFEVLGGQNANTTRLPAFVKAKIGADPLKDDTDDDGLSDYFELMKMGLLTEVGSNDTNNNGLADALEDPDNDGLTNIREQLLGTDPLVPDTDHDDLKDGYEVDTSHTNPMSEDSDNDGLRDDSELRIGTDPNNPDSNTNGVLDGNETYTSKTANSTFGIYVSVTGRGDLASQVTISNETSEYYTNISGMVSPLVDLDLNGSFDSAMISMQYDPALNASNLSLCYFNESLGLYVPVTSQINAVNHTISANTSHFSMWAIFDVKALQALYKQISDFNHEAYYGNVVGIPTPGDNLTVPYDSSLIVTFVEADTAYNDQFGFWSPVRRTLGYAHSTTPGTVYNLGNYTSGTELIFYLVNDPGNTWLSGPASRNPDRVAHAYIKPISDDTYNLGWEDYYGGGDRDYNDVILNITFVRSASLDTDGDGLPDYLETHGIMDNLGHIYHLNATDSDTDHDGLTDDEEVGVLKTNANGYIQYSFNVISDPTLKDRDNDGLNDDEELYLGTKPLDKDTDGDTILDGADPNPLVKDVPDLSASTLETVRIIIIGAVFGDTGDVGGWFHGLVGDETSGSPFYLLGAILGGLVPIVADLRDTLQSIGNLDALGTVLNAIGFIPGPGDAVKITGTIGIFMVKHADDAKYAVGVTQVTTKYLLKYMPDFIYKPAIRALTNSQVDRLLYIGMDWNTIMRLGSEGTDIGKMAAHSDRLLSTGSDPDAIKVLIENAKVNGGTLSVNLDKTMKAVKNSDGNVRWLEEGTTNAERAGNGMGWRHILVDHKQDFIDKFGYISDAELESMLFECMDKGVKYVTKDGKDAFVYTKSGKTYSVIVGSNGFIQSAHPDFPSGVIV